MICYSELSHHGIKGQKWGVRHGPPYPIEDTVLKKGSKLNTVSAKSDSTELLKTGRWLYTYNPDDEWDNKVYKGAYAAYLIKYRGQNYLHEHSYEVAKDLKMPTKKERIDEFINTYNMDVNTYSKDLKYVQDLMQNYNMGSQESRSVNVKKLKTDADYKAAYEVFNHAMENASAFKITKKYSEIMSTKYDAMVDDNNQSIYNDAHDPIIIFRANEALKPISKVRALTYKEIADNYLDVEQDLSKKGRNIKL